MPHPEKHRRLGLPVRAADRLRDDLIDHAELAEVLRRQPHRLGGGRRLLAAAPQDAVGAVEELVGRRVIGYHSQIVFNPTKAFEIFALEPRHQADDVFEN